MMLLAKFANHSGQTLKSRIEVLLRHNAVRHPDVRRYPRLGIELGARNGQDESLTHFFVDKLVRIARFTGLANIHWG